MAELANTTIGELIASVGGTIKTGPFGTALKASEYTRTGVPVISVGEIGYGVFRVHDSTPRVPPAVTTRLSDYILREGDIVFARKGAVDRSARITAEQEGWFLGSDGIRLRLPATTDSRFMAYQLQSPSIRRWMIQHATGTTMASLNQGVIGRIPVFIPPMHHQRAIAVTLGALDDKIELNRRMNETLEELAGTIFQGMNRSAAADVNVEDLLDPGWLLIGDGYRAKNSELATDGLPFIRAGNLASRVDFAGAERLSWTSVSLVGSKRSKPLDTAFTSKGTVGRITLVHRGTPEFVYSPQVCFWRSLNADCLNPHVLHEWMRSPGFRRQIDAVKGQTDMAEYVSLRDQRRMRVPLLPREEQARLASQLAPLHDRVGHNWFEIDTLAELRDLLLPKLISGQLQIRDAEKMAEAVL